MYFKRTWDGATLQHWQSSDGDIWRPRPEGGRGECFASGWLDDRAREQTEAGGQLIAIQPASFHDFLLFERHNIDASRGLVRRFHRWQYGVTRAYEAVSRTDFPAFRPHRLFYRQPLYYFGNHLTFLGDGAKITTPLYSQALDYELEFGFTISRPLYDATPDEAFDAIDSLVLLNDFSARDVQRAEMATGFGPQKSKHFLTTMSTLAVPASKVLPELDQLTGTVELNGRLVAEVTCKGMQWSLGEVLSHASRSERLLPGEVFGSGTLPGGSGMENGHWLKPGDTLHLTLQEIGSLTNTVHAP